ncbi:hypothetical protein O181_015673 [Austropuccinia psidii MF-1]|uniref:Uncharacterized protein n=1 Tax=Austropuccinia psidii MF-1 TaxID=1389203 RepID=A0A9Q3GQ68_9BASI|nr:hypothetical protein [Austropuccinia psidii MF-1]
MELYRAIEMKMMSRVSLQCVASSHHTTPTSKIRINRKGWRIDSFSERSERLLALRREGSTKRDLMDRIRLIVRF